MNSIPLGIYRHYKGNQYEVTGFAERRVSRGKSKALLG